MSTLFSCSTIRVSQDYNTLQDITGLQTYKWKSLEQEPSKDIRIDNQFLDSRIRTAIELYMRSAGFTEVSNDTPDFFIQYNYSIKRRIKSDNVQTGFGIGVGSYGRRGGVSVHSGSNIREIDEGLFVIDFTKPDSGDLIWRGMGTSQDLLYSNPEKATVSINALVEKIIGQITPK